MEKLYLGPLANSDWGQIFSVQVRWQFNHGELSLFRRLQELNGGPISSSEANRIVRGNQRKGERFHTICFDITRKMRDFNRTYWLPVKPPIGNPFFNII